MTLIEQPQEHLAVIDPVFDDNDHFICCEIPTDFVGSTMTFCGKEIFQAYPEVSSSVGCPDCMAASKKTTCPLGKYCEALHNG